MRLDYFGYTNKGGRNNNEDCIAYIEKDDNAMFVVADGLGGHQYGELASEMVCEVFYNSFNDKFGKDVEEWIKKTTTQANDKVLEAQLDKNTIIKSTMAVVGISDGKATWANVGDTRIYFIHNNQIESITNDHSVAYKKYKAGEITREQIATDSDQSTLLKTIGRMERFEPEFAGSNITLEPGDAFFICTDGAWEYLYDEEILIDYCKAQDATKWGELCLLRIIDRIKIESDNLSVVTIMIK